MCLDFSKAFDSVDHDILCSKLERSRIRGTALKLLRSYVTDCSQYDVDYDKTGRTIKSEFPTVARGVKPVSVFAI